MPIDWAPHKAELEQLYVNEGRTLEDVRDTLRARSGFHPSTRSYRTKFDEWGWRRYKVTKPLQPPSRKTEVPNANKFRATSALISSICDALASSQVQVVFGNDIAIPTGPLAVLEVIPLIKGPSAHRYALEILITKWLPGGEYMNAALRYLKDPACCWSIMENTSGGTNLFSLIKTNLPYDEQQELSKAMLEADTLLGDSLSESAPRWASQWRAACSANDWESAKSILKHENIIPPGAALAFRGCAQVVIAECLLGQLMDLLREESALAGPCNGAESQGFEHARQQYLDILRDFQFLSFDVSPKWYKDYLQVADWAGTSAKCVHGSCAKCKPTTHPSCGMHLDESMNNFLDLTLDRKVTDATPHGIIPTTGQASQYISSSQDSNWVIRGDSWAGDSAIEPNYNTYGNPLTNILRSWKPGSDVKFFVEHQLFKPGSTIRVLNPAASGGKDLFDVIYDTVEVGNRVAVAKAFLLALYDVFDVTCRSWQFTCWRSAFTEPVWTRFKTALAKLQLGECMSHNAAKLVREATFQLAGKRLLDAYKIRLDTGHATMSTDVISRETLRRREQYFGSVAHYLHKEQYNTILEDFRSRARDSHREEFFRASVERKPSPDLL